MVKPGLGTGSGGLGQMFRMLGGRGQWVKDLMSQPIDPPQRLAGGRISTIDTPGAGVPSVGAYLSPLVNGQSTQGKLQMRLNGGPEAAGAARGVLHRLDDELEPPVVEALRLLVTELIANSVKHADALTVGLKILVGSSAV